MDLHWPGGQLHDHGILIRKIILRINDVLLSDGIENDTTYSGKIGKVEKKVAPSDEPVHGTATLEWGGFLCNDNYVDALIS